MPIRVGQLILPEFNNAFNKLLEAQVSAKMAFKLKGISKILDDEKAKFEFARLALVKKYAERDEKGEIKTNSEGVYKVDESKMNEFITEFNELIKIEIDVPSINFEELGDKVSLTAKELILLEGLVVSSSSEDEQQTTDKTEEKK